MFQKLINKKFAIFNVKINKNKILYIINYYTKMHTNPHGRYFCMTIGLSSLWNQKDDSLDEKLLKTVKYNIFFLNL